MSDQGSQRRCLVIGGGGFIGSFLVPELLKTGRHVTVLGRQQSSTFPLPSKADYVSGSFADVGLLASLLDTHSEVVHLAYATVPSTSFADPLADLQQNVPPAVTLFSEVAARGGRLVLLSSGGAVYGEALRSPVTESHPTAPISPYGLTKLTLEKYARLYGATHGLQAVCVRPSNAYGPGQRPFTGQGFVATAMGSAMRRQPVVIYGDQGTVRDYIHVSDLARGILAAVEMGLPGHAYNLGSGIGRSQKDVLRAIAPIARKWGCQLNVCHHPARPFDVRENVLDCSALSSDTGWQPKVAFEDGLDSTWAWLRDHELQ